MAQKKTMHPVNQEKMALYLNYLLTGQVGSEADAKEINELSKRIVTLGDATLVAKVAVATLDQKLTQVMEVLQIQSKVLAKLGATPELFEEAEKEYNDQVDAMRKTLEAQAKAAKEATEKVEE